MLWLELNINLESTNLQIYRTGKVNRSTILEQIRQFIAISELNKWFHAMNGAMNTIFFLIGNCKKSRIRISKEYFLDFKNILYFKVIPAQTADSVF